MKELLIVQAGGNIDALDELVRDHFHSDNTETYYPKQARKFLQRAAHKAYGTNAIRAKGWDMQDATQAMLQKALYVHDNPEEYSDIRYRSSATILGTIAMGIDVLTHDTSSQWATLLYASIRDNYGSVVPDVLKSSRGPYSEWNHAAVIAGRALKQDLSIEAPQAPARGDIPQVYLDTLDALRTRQRLNAIDYAYLLDLVDESEASADKSIEAAEALVNVYNHKRKKIVARTGGLSEQPLVLPAALGAYTKKRPKQGFLSWMVASYKSRHAEETVFDDEVIREAVTARIVRDIQVLHSIG